MRKTTDSDPQTDSTLGEKPLLTTAFQPQALIYTYQRGQSIEVLEVGKYDLLCYVLKTKEKQHIRKIDVMFAIKADTLESVKDGIRIDKDVKARNLRTAEKPKQRPKVLTKQRLDDGLNREVRIVMRSGHVLRGRLIRHSRYNILLQIYSALVLVYRHGVLEYSVRPQHATACG